MYNVIVFLSTYNGEKYLSELLDSILKQENVNIKLIIRDDGSTDGTREILTEYRSRCSNIHLDFGINEGWRKSFFDLMFSVKPQKDTYYAFADQDDVWMKDKLINAINLINKNSNQKIPKAYHSNLIITDKNLKKIGTFFEENARPTSKMPEEIFDTFHVGATMVFNDITLALVQKRYPKRELTHDAYVMEIVDLFGKSVYDPSPNNILYRRFSDNATGYDTNEITAKPSLIQRYKKYKKSPKNGFSTRAEELLDGYQELMSEHDKKVLVKIAKYKDNFKYRLELLFDPRMHASSLRKTLQMKYRVLCNTL